MNNPNDVMYFFRVGSGQLARALVSQGCLTKKTERVFPTTEQVPAGLVPHFVRGLFDGDGTLYYSAGKGKLYGGLSIHTKLGAGLIQQLGRDLAIDLTMHKDKSIRCITFCYDKLRVFLDYIYKNCTVALAGKRVFMTQLTTVNLKLYDVYWRR